jgi:hypothetical protein
MVSQAEEDTQFYDGKHIEFIVSGAVGARN